MSDDQDQQDLFDAAEADQQEQEARRWWDDPAQIEAHNTLRAQLKADLAQQQKDFEVWLKRAFAPVPVYHGTPENPCQCDGCWNAGVRRMDREKQKRLDNL